MERFRSQSSALVLADDKNYVFCQASVLLKYPELIPQTKDIPTTVPNQEIY